MRHSDLGRPQQGFSCGLQRGGPVQSAPSLIDGLRDSASPYVALSLTARPQQIQAANDEHFRLIELYERRAADEVVALTLAHFEATLATIEKAHENGKL